ncbi:MAG: hypothetical protein CMF50_04195 [Legionellales bacterium]|nr:hypothetical protein [Legionellales bacterium]|tara:strand:- start:145 stop:2139 length:1995 start_codon:yes stop_codon:yes gene_type:complete
MDYNRREERSGVDDVREYMESILAHLPGHIYWKDLNCRFLGCNDLQASMAGLKSRDDIVGLCAFDIIAKNQPEEDRRRQARAIDDVDRRVMRTGVSETIEEPLTLEDGTVRVFLSQKVPLRNRAMEIIGLLGISMDITHQKNLEKQLANALTAADAANIAKSEFLANMSHDVRTPLTGILSMAEIMLMVPENFTRENLNIIFQSSQRLQLMLNQILDYMNSDDPQHLGEPEAFSVATVMEDLRVMFLPKALLQEDELVFTMDDSVPECVYGYGMVLHRITLNLLGNGIKFTKQGTISVDVRYESGDTDQGRLVVTVSDNGSGIPKSEQQRIFERFERVTPSYKDNNLGAGLGLSIISRYLEQVNGSIKMQSEEGVGSTFTCTIPVGLTQAVPAIIPHYISEEDEQTADKTFADSAEPAATPEVTSQGLRVLLVEDNLVAAKPVEMMLVSEACLVDHVTTGEDAVMKAASNDYDFIFMDIGLPGIDGFEAAKQISQAKSTPIFALTGHGHMSQDDLDAVGISHLYVKPLGVEGAQHAMKLSERVKRERQQASELGVIDLALGISLVNGHEDAARELLTMLYDELPEDKQQIEAALADDNHDAMVSVVHRLKGASSYCGAPRLGKRAKEAHHLLIEAGNIAAAKGEITQLLDEMDLYARAYKQQEL